MTRSHLATVLVDLGLVAHAREAFDRWLGDAALVGQPAPDFPGIATVVTAVHAAGGVALLAHPALYKDIQIIEALLDEGLDGLEVAHRGCERGLSRLLRKTAMRRQCLMSCGSDFHHPHPCRIGDWRLSQEDFAPLRERLAGWLG